MVPRYDLPEPTAVDICGECEYWDNGYGSGHCLDCTKLEFLLPSMETARKKHVYMPYPPESIYTQDVERTVHLHELVRTLNKRQQEILNGVLRGDTWGRIAELTSMHRANVKRTFKRILRRLHDEEKKGN